MTESFLPSRHGFAFANAWPDQPAVAIPTPFGTITVGNAAAGLCGGMTFAALDYWHAGRAAPSQRPGAGEQLYRFIVDRLVDSWHLPAGVAQYYQWMNLPDADVSFAVFGRRVLVERGLAWRTIKVQWPQVTRDLDRGVPVPLGLVTVASADVRELSSNHQVLAYRYDTDGAQVTVHVYDPNRGRRDDVALTFDRTHPTRATIFDHNLGIAASRVRGFFRAAYTPAFPPAELHPAAVPVTA